MALSFIGVVLSIALLIFLAYRGTSIMIAAPLAALVAIIFAGEPILAGYTQIFMPAVGNFVTNYLPIFLTGALFGRLMSLSGYAKSIAAFLTRLVGPRRAILATVLSTAVLTYGGISSFIVAFAAYPLARELFREAGIPRRLLPAALMLGLATFTMSAIPGSPQIQNVVPSQFFGTSTFAAPVTGTIGGILIFGLGMLWLEYRSKKLIAKGENFEVGHQHKRKNSEPDEEGAVKTEAPAETTLSARSTFIAFVPILLVVIINFLSVYWLIPSMDTAYLETEAYGDTTVAKVLSSWAVIIAMVVASLSIFVLNTRHAGFLSKGLAEGARNATLPLMNTGSEVGYGAVISSLAVFALVRDGVLAVSPNALIASVLATGAIAAITASATGGMTIALNTFGDDLIQMANDQGISLELMHRLTAMAAGSFDTLPHNGAVITVLFVTSMTHRQAYKDMAAVTIAVPIAVVALLIPGVLLFT